MKRFSVPLVIGAALLVFAGCGRKQQEAPDVIVLHSGRMRGNVYPLSLQSIAPLQHYQYLAGYVRKVRAEAAATGAKVLLVDLGDSLNGSFAAHVTGSENMITFFNDAGYDAVVLSNLDDTVQPAKLAKLKAAVLTPFQDASSQPATAGTAAGRRIDLKGLPVFLMANFYGDTPSTEFPDRFPAWFGTTPTAVTPVRDYAKVLAGLGPRPPGSLTLLSWMKFESPKDPPEEFLGQLRGAGVNAILAHRIYGARQTDAWMASGFYNWKPPVSVNILRNNGVFALARLDLKLYRDHWKVLGHQLLPMTANTAAADQTMVDAIAKFAGAISGADLPLAELPASVGEEAILKIYMVSLAGTPATDAVLYSRQSVRVDWPSGELRASQVFNSLPWTTGIVQLTLTPGQVAQAGKELNLETLRRTEATGPELTVTTSRFFARLITTRLGLAPDAIRSTSSNSEFDEFVTYLKAHPDAIQGTVPAGWTFTGTTSP